MRLRARRLDTAELTGRTVVVTGAGSGIGREIALLCAARGASLAICDVNRFGLAETAQLARQRGARVLDQFVDVSDAEAMNQFAADVEREFGGVDLLVNNAGVALIGGLLDTSTKDWDWLISVNVKGVAHGCAAFLPGMVFRGTGGHVVNVASAAGLLANPQLTAYSATKYAVVGLSEALRIELAGSGIGVTAVCPGVIDTAITRNSAFRGDSDSDVRREKLAALYRKRGYGPDRVARNVLRAVKRNKAVAPIAAEAHLMYLLSRFTPRAARWTAGRLARTAQ